MCMFIKLVCYSSLSKQQICQQLKAKSLGSQNINIKQDNLRATRIHRIHRATRIHKIHKNCLICSKPPEPFQHLVRYYENVIKILIRDNSAVAVCGSAIIIIIVNIIINTINTIIIMMMIIITTITITMSSEEINPQYSRMKSTALPHCLGTRQGRRKEVTDWNLTSSRAP